MNQTCKSEAEEFATIWRHPINEPPQDYETRQIIGLVINKNPSEGDTWLWERPVYFTNVAGKNPTWHVENAGWIIPEILAWRFA